MPRAGGRDEADDVAEVAREGGQRLGDALLVADVGHHPAKTGSRAPSAAGTRSPAWCMSASRPSVLSETVLPPVFGPVMIRAR